MSFFSLWRVWKTQFSLQRRAALSTRYLDSPSRSGSLGETRRFVENTSKRPGEYRRVRDPSTSQAGSRCSPARSAQDDTLLALDTHDFSLKYSSLYPR